MIDVTLVVEIPYFVSPEPLYVTLEEAIKIVRNLLQVDSLTRANSKIRFTVYMDWDWMVTFLNDKEVDDYFWNLWGLENPDDTDPEDLIRILNSYGVPVVRSYYAELCGDEELC